jgi:putative endonuclease
VRIRHAPIYRSQNPQSIELGCRRTPGITPQKQATIVRSAELFLLKHPHLAEYPCRFDVAIVRHQPLNRAIVGTPLHIVADLPSGAHLLLLDYITSAFDGT